MNRIITFLSLLVFLFPYGARANDSFKPSSSGIFFPEIKQRTVVMGVIKNLKEIPGAPMTIKLSVDDIAMGTQHQFETEVDDTGKFSFDIPLYHATNVFLRYGDVPIGQYLFLNDTLKMNCSIAKRGSRIGIILTVYDKEHDRFQNQFMKSYLWLHQNRINGFRENLPENISANEFKDRYLKFEKEILSEIDLRAKRDSLNNTLIDFLTYSARYSIYTEIIRSSSRQIIDTNEKMAFLSFLNDSIIFNKKAIITSDYNTFLAYYNMTDNELLKQQRSIARPEYDRIMKYVKFTMEKRKDIWGEYLAASLLFRTAQEVDISQTLSDSLSNMIGNTFSNTYIRQYLQAIFSKNGERVEENKNLKLPVGAILNKCDSISGEELFNKIIADNAGKVIYLDFWGTWCSSCIEQMPYSKKMQELFKDENISFVYLCCKSDARSWEKAIKKHQISGTHINLNLNQYEYFKNRFSIIGIPQYLLIDKAGKVANVNAPVPENGELVTMIKHLLSNNQ